MGLVWQNNIFISIHLIYSCLVIFWSHRSQWLNEVVDFIKSISTKIDLHEIDLHRDQPHEVDLMKVDLMKVDRMKVDLRISP